MPKVVATISGVSSFQNSNVITVSISVDNGDTFSSMVKVDHFKDVSNNNADIIAHVVKVCSEQKITVLPSDVFLFGKL